MRILLGLPLLLVDADKFLSFTGIFPKAIVGDPVKPGGKLSFSAKTPNVFVSANESVLPQIIGQLQVAPGELAQ